MNTRREGELRVGDEVEVTLRGLVEGTKLDDPTGAPTTFVATIDHTEHEWRISLEYLRERGAEFIVTTSVDHPSRDPVGTVRGDKFNAWVKVDKYPGVGNDYTGVWWNILDGEERVRDNVAEWPVIGATPGTPAARTQENT